MSIREKVTSFLFRGKPAASEEIPEEIREPASEEAAEAPAEAPRNPGLLEFPPEHPIHSLYSRSRQESGPLPAPYVCLYEDQELPEEQVERDRDRLEYFLRSICAERLRDADTVHRSSGRRRGADAESDPTPENLPPMDALPVIFLSSDRLFAWVFILPPIRKGEDVSRNMLMQVLKEEGVTFGVDMRVVNRLSHDRERYFHLFLLAKGIPAFDGKNGNIVDNFPRTVQRVLEADEYDQVDYTALNLIHNVEQGEEICRLIKPTEGEPGRTVLDREIPARSGRNVALPKGKNTEISEDGTQLLASIAGHVEFSGKSFQVKPVLDINGNVDFSTGNLNFLGDINIQGDVCSGFSVRASGDIHVDGVLEAGCSVEAGGDLVVVKGILGDGITTVRSQRSVFSKYIENASVCARENIQADCIVGSGIFCGGDVVVRSGRGAIMGGRIWAVRKVSATTVGSPSECKSSVVLGGKPCASFDQEAARREVNALEMEMEMLECQPESQVKSSLIAKVKIKLATAEMKLQQAKKGLEEEEEETEDEEGGRLECETVYPGTKVTFEGDTLRLQKPHHHCVIKRLCGEIVIM